MRLLEAILEATTRRLQQVSYRLASCIALSELLAGETKAAFVSCCLVLASDADCKRSLDDAF